MIPEMYPNTNDKFSFKSFEYKYENIIPLNVFTKPINTNKINVLSKNVLFIFLDNFI